MRATNRFYYEVSSFFATAHYTDLHTYIAAKLTFEPLIYRSYCSFYHVLFPLVVKLVQLLQSTVESVFTIDEIMC